MVIVTVQFDYDINKRYYKLLKVLVKSIKINCKSTKIHSILIDAPMGKVAKFLTANTVKLKKWVEFLEETKETNIIFSDCDMLYLKDVSHVFDLDFDVAYTQRSSGSIPYNGGILFIKNTEPAKTFIKKYNEINYKMYTDVKFHAPWRIKYAGMNQAAFGYMLENHNDLCKLISLPCNKYNVCNEDWKEINENSHIIHIKGKLRKSCIDNMPHDGDTKKAFELWKDIERCSE